MKSNLPVVFKAYQFLKSVAENLAADSEDTFPTISSLALRAGVSSMSMLRALEFMKADGKVIVSGKGKGAIIKLAHPSLSENGPKKGAAIVKELPREFRWEKTAALIAEDVLNGKYRGKGKLPSFKELHLRFGDCYYTLAKAVKALASSGLIAESGNRYVAAPLARPSRTTIYLFVPQVMHPKHISIQDERHRDFLRLIEVECKNYSLNLKIVNINDYNGSTVAREYRGDALSAIVYCDAWMAPAVLDFLIPFDRPIAFIDEWEYYRAFAATHHRTHKNVRFFLAGDSMTAAKSAGEMLLKLGHRRIAYISIYGAPHFLFSRNRYEGLRATYRAAGIRDGVTALISNELEGTPDHKSPGERMAGRPGWQGACDAVQKLVPLHSKKTVRKLIATLQTISAEEYLRQLYLPLFERALKDGDLTAWVCVNDQAAFWAKEFLNTRRKKIPGDLSLVGLDDMFYALQNEITSYNFNNPTIVHRVF
ncbi:MAG: substrate-binding domain-containing protein, partial [Chitinivibrionales bacterium]|nr:substrate-binding domain-containing protein [Chitinivibrionales bacterium]